MIFILENIRSKHNIWSVFRTCDAFRIEQLILIWICAYPPDKEISKVALWAEKVVPWSYYQSHTDIIPQLRSWGRPIISIEINNQSKSIKTYNFTWNEVLVFWNEVTWVSEVIQNLSDHILHIDINWTIKESLNVSVSAWIIWYISSLAPTPSQAHSI